MTPRNKILNELAIIAHDHKLTLREVFSASRVADVVECRNKCMWHVRSQYGYSLPKIGRMFNRNHATVYHGIAAHETKMGIENDRTRAHEIKLERARVRARALTAAA